MRRVWPSSKTNNSQRSITSERTSTRSLVPFTRAVSPACFPVCSPHFVDLGLERDAFLYVTDFMEEQEDSSDFERIPANGEEPSRRQPEPRSSGPGEPGAGEPQGGTTSGGRIAKNRRAARSASSGRWRVGKKPRRNGSAVSGSARSGGQAPAGEFEDGTRRWRGRRGRRKGFRPSPAGQQAATGTAQLRRPGSRIAVPQQTAPAAEIETEDKPVRLPIAFSLPGESLSKYGGQSLRGRPPRRRKLVPRCPSPSRLSHKPSTLIEDTHWDGAARVCYPANPFLATETPQARAQFPLMARQPYPQSNPSTQRRPRLPQG